MHPFFLEEWREPLPVELRQALRAHGRLRAVGEIGLDFYDGRGDQARQVGALAAQLGVAQELGLPVILHNRKSWSEFFGVLRDLKLGTMRGVCHHFTGSIEIARQALDWGLYLSFCGPLTYPKARRLKEAARFVPLDRMLTETDAPDLPPARYTGGLSLPYHVGEVVSELAVLKGMAPEEIAAQVERNFLALLGLDGGSG